MRFITVLLLLFVILFQTYFTFFNIRGFTQKEPIKLGILYASTGYRAAKEKLVRQSTLMAIDEINGRGGLSGRKIIPIMRDTESNLDTTFKEAKSLLEDEDIDFLFGCWGMGNDQDFSALLKKNSALLFSPFQYEGIFHLENMVFLGITANQQIPPTVDYAAENFGKNFYLIGSDYPFAHVAHQMAKDQIKAIEGKVVGETYISIDNEKIEGVIDTILTGKPDVILCSLLEEQSSLFFQRLRETGLSPEKIPVFSFSVTEATLENVSNPKDYIGHYATWNYFRSIDTPINQNFVKNYEEFSGFKAVDNSVEAGYNCVYLLEKGASNDIFEEAQGLISVFKSLRMQAPEGPITMNTEGYNAWKYSRIGKILPNKQFEIIWESKHPVRPIPYQIFRSREEWKNILREDHESS